MLPLAFLSTPELLIVAVIIIVLFGASRIPEIGKSIADGINAFRKALDSKDEKNNNTGNDSGNDKVNK